MRKLLLAAALLAAGCSKSSPPAAAVDPGPAGSPAPAEARKASEVLAGTVLEKLESGQYSLLRLKTATGEVWAALPRSDRKVGEEVTVIEPLPMQNFESKPLRRTFAQIYFGNPG